LSTSDGSIPDAGKPFGTAAVLLAAVSDQVLVFTSEIVVVLQWDAPSSRRCLGRSAGRLCRDAAGGKLGGMNLWDIAAGILIGAGLIMGMVWGVKRGGAERPFYWACLMVACAIVMWRTSVWYHGPEAQPAAADLYAKYDLIPPGHQ
jgi:hypothetical protein